MMNKERPEHVSFIQRIKEKVRLMKQDTLALYYAYSDPETPLIAKVLIWITVGYLLSPIDLIPDFIPVLGLLDDLVIVPLLIIASVRLIPKAVWEGSLRRAKLEPLTLKKSNRLFAGLIILIWVLFIALIYYAFSTPSKFGRY